jgi:drug/metabolite transporter (DMT)-like permease
MKWLLNILGAILVLVGVIWILQGVNILPGSFMSGHILYAILGIIVGAVGAFLLTFTNRRRKDVNAADQPH